MKENSKVYNEDCLRGLKNIEDGSVDMIYLDPPFFTQRKQKLSNKEGNVYCFNDNWKNINEYISFLKTRLLEIRRVLKDTGSVFVHCDKAASHYIRCVLDEVFGYDMFQSEIIWTYKRWSNSKKGLLDAHQNIYFYSKTKKFKFNFKYTNYSSTTNLDQIYQDRIRNENGKTVYKLDENGNAVSTNEKKGVPLSDTWDIPYLNPKAKERCGYPTQKPLNLLERIIEISTDENDLVIDPFCGSGTTLVAAKRLHRQFIGFDISQEACELANQRLVSLIKSESEVLKKGKAAFENKTEKELAILKQFDCDVVQRNKGLDGILRKKIDDSFVGIKIQKDTETLYDAYSLLEYAMKKRGFKKSILIKTHDDILDMDVQNTNIIIIESYEFQLNKMINDF